MSSSPSVLKPPKAPEKPLVPYMRYSKKVWFFHLLKHVRWLFSGLRLSNSLHRFWCVQVWQKVRESEKDRGNYQLWNIGKKIGEMWRELSDSEKAVYQVSLVEYKYRKNIRDYLLKNDEYLDGVGARERGVGPADEDLSRVARLQDVPGRESAPFVN